MSGTVIGAQMYTVREFTKTPPEIARTIGRLKAIGYDAVQVSAIGPIEPAELARICQGEGVTIAATHTPWQRLVDEPQAVIDEHHLWGCKYVAIGGIPSGYNTEEGYARFGREASEVARRLAQGGLVFGYHNHAFELEHFNGKTGLEILMEHSDPQWVTFEIDTYWIQFGGGDPVQWIRRAAGRMPLLHLKDMVAHGWEQRMAEVGEGNLNWPAILDAARDAGTVWYLVEQDVCQRDPFESLAISLANLHRMGLR